LAWSKGRRPPGAVATFIACTVRALVIGFLCYGALEIVGVTIIIIIIISFLNPAILSSVSPIPSHYTRSSVVAVIADRTAYDVQCSFTP